MSQIIKILAPKILANSSLIEDWFTKKFAANKPNFYNSVDLRHAGFKIAPVDTNCFPAGFNNLSAQSKEYAKIVVKNYLAQNFPAAKNILLVPENHTRNMRYLENIAVLQEILQSSVSLVVIGSLIEDLHEKTIINLESGKKIELHPLIKNDTKITTDHNIEFDIIVLNNDLTGGIPAMLQNLQMPVVPDLKLGWYQRTKSNHFSIYNNLAQEFSRIIDIDYWLISSLHHQCHDVDFKERVGIECLAKYTDEMLQKLKEKYQQHGIKEEPYCYIKADNGTYGMAVMPVFSSADILEINKKERNKMNMLKESTQNTVVMIQEGIKTIDKINNKVSEPMIYMLAGQVVGNLFRVNQERNQQESLNAAGAEFFDLRALEENQIDLGGNKNEIAAVYSVISRLAALAAAGEI